MTAEELTRRIVEVSERWPYLNHQALGHLRRRLRDMPDDALFDGLIAVFTEPSSDAYAAQEYAGRLLEVMNPKPQAPLDDLLPRVLPSWNRSIEQLPAYLARAFGRDAVLDALERVDRASVVLPELTDTVRFWLRALPLSSAMSAQRSDPLGPLGQEQNEGKEG